MNNPSNQNETSETKEQGVQQSQAPEGSTQSSPDCGCSPMMAQMMSGFAKPNDTSAEKKTQHSDTRGAGSCGCMPMMEQMMACCQATVSAKAKPDENPDADKS